MLVVTLLGTGSPIPDPHRAGPATLIQGGKENYLVDAGRGVLMRLAAVGGSINTISAVLLTHLHSDHITDLTDIITSSWILNRPGDRTQTKPLQVVGPPGTREVIAGIISSLSLDISYRMAHHDVLTGPPEINIIEIEDGAVNLGGQVRIRVAATDHRPVEPTIGFRFDYEKEAVVVAGDTVPCTGLDELCKGADALVHTAMRKDIIGNLPNQPMARDILSYHSSVEEASQTAARAEMDTLILTHYIPTFPPDGGDDWMKIAAQHFSGSIELGNDLHRVEIHKP